jgi:hypothetical protein
MKRFIVLAFAILSTLMTYSRSEIVDMSNLYSQRNAIGPHDSLIDIFRSLDLQILQSKDEKLISKYLISVNARCISYLKYHYPQYGPYEVVDTNDPAATLFSLLYAIFEGNDFQDLPPIGTIANMKIPEWLTCSLGVITSAYGIKDIISSLGEFTAGSIWKIVKMVVKKYVVGWVAIAVTLVQIGSTCFD